MLDIFRVHAREFRWPLSAAVLLNHVENRNEKCKNYCRARVVTQIANYALAVREGSLE